MVKISDKSKKSLSGFAVPNSGAFSLAEAMIALLIAALILAATMPVITKKHLLLPTRGPHGKWACKVINGKMYHATGADQNSPLPSDDSKWKEGCDFPVLPSNVPYMLIQTIGGGGGGNHESGKPELNLPNPTGDTFDIPDDGHSTFEIPVTGDYEVSVRGERGETGYIGPWQLNVIVDNTLVDSCEYPGAPPENAVGSVRYTKKYNAGDELWIERQSDTEIETNAKLCQNSSISGGTVTLADGRVLYPVSYTFQVPQVIDGANGDKLTLWEKDRKTQHKSRVVEITGSAGGIYRSSTANQNCDMIRCTNRYAELKTRNVSNPNSLVKNYGMPGGFELGAGASTSVRPKEILVELKGGCGGAAGTVNSILYPRMEDYGDIPIKIGDGGLEGQDGGTTVFNTVTARGGSGCSQTTSPGVDDKAGMGGDGAAADTASKNDSIGGAGGTGGFSMAKAGNGGNGRGLGSGGGGGGAAVNLTKEQIDQLKKTDKSQIYNKTTFGMGGKGAPGGIIVSW